MSSRHSSDNALTSLVGGSVGAGGVAVMLPSSPLLHEQSVVTPNVNGGVNGSMALNLSTYTAGEDSGRLAILAKEFGLARIRSPKRQIRHTFKDFLRNHRDDLNEDIISQQQPEDDKIPQSQEATDNTPFKRHPPLRFVFSGYSLWLELEQNDIDDKGQGDLDRAMIDAADRFSLGGAIPSPHVTALYGIDVISDEAEVRRIFREGVQRVLLIEAEKRRRKGEEEGVDDIGKLWPDLDATGIIVDTEFDGVNGGTMDMAWAEVSFATSPFHEALINALHKLFYCHATETTGRQSSFSSNEEKKEEYVPRSTPWVPHLSLCYDNPEGLNADGLSRPSIEKFLNDKCPTLNSVLDESSGDIKFSRAVSGISLWRTAGRMDQWKCLDRFEFPAAE